MNPLETEHGRIALEFAKTLVSGDYSSAYSFVELKEKMNLENEFNEMIEYGEGPVNHIEVMNEMDSWPTKNENDIGWAYVAIAGEGFSEAVAVVISNINGATKITSIEWGRP